MLVVVAAAAVVLVLLLLLLLLLLLAPVFEDSEFVADSEQRQRDQPQSPHQRDALTSPGPLWASFAGRVLGW